MRLHNGSITGAVFSDRARTPTPPRPPSGGGGQRGSTGARRAGGGGEGGGERVVGSADPAGEVDTDPGAELVAAAELDSAALDDSSVPAVASDGVCSDE